MKIYRTLAKRSYLLATVGLLTLIVVLAPLAVRANNNEKAVVDIQIPEGSVYEDVLITAGQYVTIKGHFKDDIYAAGANVTISGLVEGDVIVAGANVTIEAEIKGNLRVAAANVTIKGKVDKNITVAAADLVIEQGAEVGRNIFVGAGNFKLNNKVNKNIYGAAGSILLNNEIMGNVYLNVDPTGEVILYPATIIHGNLEYTAGQTAEFKSGAKVFGEEKFSQFVAPETKAFVPHKFWRGISLITNLIGFLGSLLVGLILIYLLKDFTLQVHKEIDKKIFLSILKGLLAVIVIPLALFIVAVTIIGLPLALIIAALYCILLYVSKIYIGLYLGTKIFKLFKGKELAIIWPLILGLLVLYLLFIIPFLGALVRIIVVFWGVGVLLSVIKTKLNWET